MHKRIMDFLCERLKRADISFSEKLRLTSDLISWLDEVEEAQILRLLLENSLITRPSYGDLYNLCEMSDRSETVQNYLRGFFVQGSDDPLRAEMAQRLDGVISFRMAQNVGKTSERKLHQTLAEYLLRAKN